jgi:protein-glutamine gamma-glutamyltransferase
MWSVAWFVLAYTIATPAATGASALGAFLAFFGGRHLAKSNIRTLTVSAAAIVLSPILLSLADFPNRSPFVAGFFPSANSLVFLTDLAWWGLLSMLVVGLLQFLSTRHQFFISVEVLTVALFLASPFTAHREGFINRPYFLIDPLWSRGYDPVPVLQGIGIVVAVALILLTIGRATQRSSILDLVLLSFLALVLYLYAPQEAIRELVSDPPGASGLTGEPKEGSEGQGQPPPSNGGSSAETLAGESGGGSGDEPNTEFPFESSDQSDPKPVAVVIFRDDYEPPDGYYYFRQSAFSQYNGFRLVKDTTGKADTDLFKRFPTRLEQVPPPPQRLEIPTGKLETRVALISSHTEPFGLTKPLDMNPVSNPNPDKFERAYEVTSHVYKGQYNEILASTLEDPRWDEETKQYYLQHPKDERYKKLADEIIAGIPEEYRDLPLAKTLAINLYLGEKGKYTIRKRPVAGSEDPTADFLFGDMTGYCVHFSHSAVYLLRAAGVPARVGVGYAIESRDRRGSALLVLSSRAHAWPEVWVDGLGWYPMDVAPQTNLDPPVAPPDYDLQSMLAEMAREEGDEYEQIEQVDFRQMLKNLVSMIIAFLPWLVGAFLFLAYGLKLERRLFHRFEKDEAKVHSLYKAALDKASDAGFKRRLGQGRLSFAEQHQQALPSLTPLTSAHLSHKFGKQGRAVSDIQQLQSDYDNLHRELTEAAPLWRRALGALNPISWYFTR